MSLSEHKKMTGAELDAAFDAGEEDVLDYFDLKSAKMHYPVKRISIDFPTNVLNEVGVEAAKIGVTRTSLIKMWVSEQLLRHSQAAA